MLRCLLVLLLMVMVSPAAMVGQQLQAAPLGHTGLDAGYYDMYNLDFAGAHQVFGEWMKAHPDDPLGPASDAAAFLFSEFDRLGVLDVELFTDDDTFTGRGKLQPNPEIRKKFEARASEAENLANAELKQHPGDVRALYTLTLMSGMHANYAAMIDKKDYAALKYTEQGSKYAEETLKADPNLYDAYIAVGVENYMLALKPPIMKLFFLLRGDPMDKEEGIRQMRLCAEKGHYLAPFAQLMLAVTDIRANNKAGARQILAGLAKEFPRNTLYQRQLERIH
jgi:hypothetical protein